jgi:hypothetical protein
MKYIEYSTQPMFIGLNGFQDARNSSEFYWEWESVDAGVRFPSTFVNWDECKFENDKYRT